MEGITGNVFHQHSNVCNRPIYGLEDPWTAAGWFFGREEKHRVPGGILYCSECRYSCCFSIPRHRYAAVESLYYNHVVADQVYCVQYSSGYIYGVRHMLVPEQGNYGSGSKALFYPVFL